MMKVYPVYYNDHYTVRVAECICATEERAKQECDRLIAKRLDERKRKAPADTHETIVRNSKIDPPYFYEEVDLLP